MKKIKNNVGADASVRPTSKERHNKGITLIALVITIIVMLILVAVTISMAVNGGLFDYAGKATGETQNAIDREQQLANLEANMTVDELIDKYTEGEKKECIGTEKSYVGCYADFEGDGTIDGIIYADLAKGNTKGEKWANDEGVYSIPVETGLKEYYVSRTGYVGSFGTEPRDVITAIEGNGKDRFYVMALENVGGSSTGYCWYYAAYGNMGDYATATSVDFGKGKDNTTNMIAKWDEGSGSGGYGAQDADDFGIKDMWGQIKNQVANGWFVPSRGEWAAFAQELGITKSNYDSYGLSDYYWTSAQDGTQMAWSVLLDSNDMYADSVDSGYYLVRLSATF